MKQFRIRLLSALFGLVASLQILQPSPAVAETAAKLDAMVTKALDSLYAQSPGTRELGQAAKGILVFPRITKGGFLIGGQYGVGALRINNQTYGYYKSMAASYGLQAGVQKFGYALFIMDDESLKYLQNSEGWELGVGPTLTVVDKGMATSITTTTARKGVYAFFFDQKGLMAGIGIQGSKISPYTPEKPKGK